MHTLLPLRGAPSAEVVPQTIPTQALAVMDLEGTGRTTTGSLHVTAADLQKSECLPGIEIEERENEQGYHPGHLLLPSFQMAETREAIIRMDSGRENGVHDLVAAVELARTLIHIFPLMIAMRRGGTIAIVRETIDDMIGAADEIMTRGHEPARREAAVDRPLRAIGRGTDPAICITDRINRIPGDGLITTSVKVRGESLWADMCPRGVWLPDGKDKLANHELVQCRNNQTAS